MVTFLFTSVVVLGLIAIAIYFWQKPANRSQTTELPPPLEHGRGLFADNAPEQLPPTTEAIGSLPDNTNKALAEELIESFNESPDRSSTVKMLHTAALSDDAEIYRKAIETALRLWREGKISDLSPTELQTLFTSEFWVLSSGTRSSGGGFILKRALTAARRELEGTNTTDPTIN